MVVVLYYSNRKPLPCLYTCGCVFCSSSPSLQEMGQSHLLQAEGGSEVKAFRLPSCIPWEGLETKQNHSQSTRSQGTNARVCSVQQVTPEGGAGAAAVQREMLLPLDLGNGVHLSHLIAFDLKGSVILDRKSYFSLLN